ncbi:YfiR family protein [Maridesulfovibrio zosterae]|uniref:YfiR family protein n=1 Tax=Maridesulfovibrio zosterae TaxID=82171 RepID=UPI000417BFC4|nr:YfiR family protein [Maridesulfovibrio zosterae]
MGFLKIHKIMAVMLASFFVLYSIPIETAQARIVATQPQLQALFIKKITKYVLTPDMNKISAIRPVTVAAIMPHEMAAFFKKSDGFKLVRWPAANCEVLFIGDVNPRIMAAVLEKVKGKPILTIGRSPYFLSMGGMINLVENGSRFKLQVNVCAARKAGLTISSKLLKLSDVYCGENPQ